MTSLDPAQALGNLPPGLRDELLDEYKRISKNFARGDWGDTSVHGGRFCEVVYAILEGHVTGEFPKSAAKPPNLPQRCWSLHERVRKNDFPQSVRVGIPRVLIGLYEIRNNRDSGHVGGEVDANHMDASYVLHAVQWVMSELVRIFHAVDTAAASSVVEALTDRTVPLIWEVNGRRRITDTSMKLADKTLMLLYGSVQPISDAVLADDLKHKRLRDYKKTLRSLDADVLVEYDEPAGLVTISPKGDREVEDRLLPSLDLA